MMRRSFLASAAAALTGACGGLDDTELAKRWPPLGRIIDVDGVPVHLWEKGEGQPVVLIHGASGNLRDWTFRIAPRLAQTHRVIAMDRPGFGYSARLGTKGWDPAVQARHLAKAVDRIGAEDPIVVGHSWGGALAMAWGVEHPSSTKGVVSVGGATMPWGGDLSFFYSLAASDVTGGLVSRIVHAAISEERIASFLESTFAPQDVPSGYAAYVGGPLATRPSTVRHNARDLINLDRALERQAARYGDLQLPVEILHGTSDDTVYADLHAEGMHAILPNSRLELLSGVGHMPHHARPEALFAAINRLTAA